MGKPLYTMGKYALLLSSPALMKAYALYKFGPKIAKKLGPKMLSAATSKTAMKNYKTCGRKVLSASKATIEGLSRFGAKAASMGWATSKKAFNFMKSKNQERINTFNDVASNAFSLSTQEIDNEQSYDNTIDVEYTESIQQCAEGSATNQPFEIQDAASNEPIATNLEEISSYDWASEYDKVSSEIDRAYNNHIPIHETSETQVESTGVQLDSISIGDDMVANFSRNSKGEIIRSYTIDGTSCEGAVVSMEDYIAFKTQASQISNDRLEDAAYQDYKGL